MKKFAGSIAKREAAESQNYTPTQVFKSCSTCANFIKKAHTYSVVNGNYKHRCGVGGFVVTSSGICDLYRPAQS